MLRWIKNFSLWLLGAVLLQRSIKMIFEYSEGLADVSWHEWAFLLLMPLLLWRHISYCQYFSTGVWSGLSRLLIAQGLLGVLFFFGIGLLMAILVLGEYVDGSDLTFGQENPLVKLVEYGLILLAVYLAAPVSKKPPYVKQTTSTQIESAIPTVTDEIVQ